MRRLATTLSITAALAVAACLAVAAGPHDGPPPPNEGPFLERLIDRLDLSAEQEEQFLALVDKHREQMREQSEQLRAARSELRASIHAAELDEAAIRGAAADVAVIEADMAVARAKHFQEMRKILTPEQQAMLDEMRERREERMKERFGRHSRRHDHWGHRP